MQEMIQRILAENFDNDGGSLMLSCTEINISMQSGTVFEGEFEIQGSPNVYTTGKVFASDSRMECLVQDFSGSQATIPYCFHGENMEPGEVVKGKIYIMSNQGEYYIPFVVSIEHTVLQSSIGPIKNLFHFANLAKTNWQEAVQLFYSHDFYMIFQGNDSNFMEYYRGLCAHPGNQQNVEEFLIQINKKQKVTFLFSEKDIVIDGYTAYDEYERTQRELSITRNGWGYTRLDIAVEGDFILLEKSMITDDDFLGNLCKLPFYIDISGLGAGRHYGKIRFRGTYDTIEVSVIVKIDQPAKHHGNKGQRKKAIFQLMKYYQAFRMKKINTSVWLKETEKQVDQLIVMDEEDIPAKLFKAQLLITQERYNEASWMLDHAVENMEDPGDDELWAYYYYLTTLIRREESYVDQMQAEVEMLYRGNRDSYRIAWLLLYLSEEYSKSASVTWQFLKQQFEMGSNSFLIYTEALLLMNQNPTLLRSLDDFELQVLYYGAKLENLGQDVVEQLIYICTRVKDYNNLLCRLLMRLYEKKADARLLQEICTMLIKGGKTEQKYFKWYALGVEHQLRITNLYEYYMASLDLNQNEELPKTLLMYFSYQTNLDYEHMAYLYGYVCEHQEDVGELYDSYRMRMEKFILQQIGKKHINRPLSKLYNQMFSPHMLDENIAEAFSELIYAHYIHVETPSMCRVLIYQPDCILPREYPINEQKGWIAIYGTEYTLVFEDLKGNRYTSNVEYTLEKLMTPGKYLKDIMAYQPNNLMIDLMRYKADMTNETLNKELVPCCHRLMTADCISPQIRKSCYLRLLDYYYQQDDMSKLDDMLLNVIQEEFTMSEKASLVKYMVLRGLYKSAFSWVVAYGPYFLDLNTLVRLVSAMVAFDDTQYNPILVTATRYVFKKGKYNNAILEYLGLYYEGLTKDMREVWKASVDFGVECYRLSERILIQMLYTSAYVGEKMEIFKYYVAQGGKTDVIHAFLAQNAYDYFVKGKITDHYVFREIASLYRQGESVQKVEKLAYLMYHAENPQDISESTEEILQVWMKELLSDKVHMNFFKDIKCCKTLIGEIEDKSIVEYRAKPGNRAKIHYLLLKEDGEEGEYLAEYMREVYDGVFYKEFILFFGETLQYYIMEECDDKDQLTESGTLQKNDIVMDGQGTRYDLINDMAISKALQDYDMLDLSYENLCRQEYYNEQLFQIH